MSLITNDAILDVVKQFSGLIESDHGFLYRDLNKNGKLDIYEDARQPIASRVEDLLSQMTLEEKAGMMFHNGSVVNADGSIEDRSKPGVPEPAACTMVDMKKMSHFNLWAIPSAKVTAGWYNNLQCFAEQTRLGIPVTISSDPRNQAGHTVYFDMDFTDFTQWCNAIGFGAVGDPELVRQFANIARQEYLAVGIRMALHPQIDLATEPRWPRINGTFGEDAHLSAKLARAYIEGFQGERLGPESVACMAKHFPGGGPQNEGLDAHFEFHKGQVYPGNNFDYHLIPFEAAMDAHTAAIMPYYGVPMDQTDENVGVSYNKTIITGLLREKYRFEGVVCTDWTLVTDQVSTESAWPARAWGAEHLSEIARVQKIIEAGVDQFGGENRPELVVELVRTGLVSESRIDQSVRRLLRLKFQLGLFDNPFANPSLFSQVFGRPEYAKAAAASQRRSMTLLKNDQQILPLQGRPKIYLVNLDAGIGTQYGEVVATPQEADIAILHLSTPWSTIEAKNPFTLYFHHGDLDFKGEDLRDILSLLRSIPTVVSIYMDRPAVIPEIAAAARAVVVHYGASDAAILDVIFGRARPEGKLPFELPSSMEAVRNQKPDVPYDSQDPLYRFGFGLSY